MKAWYFIISLLLLSLFSFSQEKDQSKGWYFGPNISYVAAEGHYYEGKFHNIATYYKYYNSYSAGLDGLYAFGRKHTLNFGVHYQEMRCTSNHDFAVDTLSNPQKVSNGYGRYVGRAFSAPIHMDFCLFKGKYSPYVITGIMPELYFENKYFERITYANGSVEENSSTRHYNYFHVSWQVGFGLDVNLSKSKFRIFVYDSGYECPIFINSFGCWRFWDYSIHTGISYYIKTSHR